MSSVSSATDSNVVSPRSPYRDAYDRVLAEAEAVPEDALVNAATDVDTITAAVIPRLESIAELDADAGTLPKFGLRDFQQLGVRVLALAHAESEYRMAVAPPPPIDDKLEQLTRAKNYLLAQAEVLILAGAISPEPIEALKFNTGHRMLASNTRHVVVYLVNHWDTIAPHTTLKLDELYGYERLADEVHTAVVRRDDQPKKVAKAGLVRRQIMTLVFRSLRELERAAEYLHGDDAERFIPRVFAAQGRRKAKAEPAPATPPAQSAGSGGGAAALPSAPSFVDEPGHPNSSPFMR
jgi:hypothetical protein